MSHREISTRRQLEQYAGLLAGAAWIAVDSEFVSERTYRPVLCLVQVATPEGLALVDAVAIGDIAPFWQALSEPGHETIAHAARSEFEFCLRAVGRRPAGLVDVQIAAGLAGIEYPAPLRTLVWRLLGKSCGQQETRTDWCRRPLSSRQIEYALDDVRYLPAVRQALGERLERLGRLAWLDEEMAAWQEETERSLGDERWRRVSGNSGLDRQSLAVLRELWRWREAEAQKRDCPPRRVLRDDLLVELAKRKSADLRRIRAVRGLERGDLTRLLPAIAQRIDEALSLPEEQWPARSFAPEKDPQLPMLGQFLYSALGSVCRQLGIAPALLGTPSDVRDLIAYRTGRNPSARPPRLTQGWRAEVVGNLFDDLLAGKKSIRIQDPASEHPLVFEDAD